MYDVIIVGGGVSAFAAALYSGRFHMKTLLLGETLGGTIILTDKVDNYPGFSSISGQDLFDKIRKHAEEYDIEVKEEKVEAVEKKDDLFTVKSLDGSYEAKTVIIATGTEWRKLKVPGEKEFTGNGVHYCALCDGYIYDGKTVAIVGGSDSAAKEALLLSEYAKKVYMIYRKEKIRAEPINAKKVEENQKIEIITNTNITQIKGGEVVDRVVLDREHEGSYELPVDGVFIDIGHIPISQLVQGTGVKMNEKGEILTEKSGATNVPGLYAAGDVGNHIFKQAITGVGEGVSAAFSAYRFVNRHS
mgnify:CR=1 FL=1